MKLRNLIPNFHIHVSVSDLYIPQDRSSFFLQHNRKTDRGNMLIAHKKHECRHLEWKKIYIQDFQTWMNKDK